MRMPVMVVVVTVLTMNVFVFVFRHVEIVKRMRGKVKVSLRIDH